MMEKLYIGIVGTGSISQKVYLPELSQQEGLVIQALCDTDLAKAERLAERYQVPQIYGDVRELVQRPDLDCILICTPNASHSTIAALALQAGKHVICEKPLTTTPAAAAHLVKLSCEQGKTLLVSFPNRFRPEIEVLRSIIHDGELGKIYRIEVGWLRRRGVPGAKSWFTSKRHAGGGVLIDLGSHLLDLVLWLLPPPSPRKATVFGTIHDLVVREDDMDASWYGQACRMDDHMVDVEDTAVATLVLDNAISVSLEVAWISNALSADTTYITVHGKDGAADLRTLFGFSTEGTRPRQPLTIYRRGEGAPQRITVPGADDPFLCFRRQIAFFSTQLRQAVTSLSMAEAGLQNIMLIDAIYSAHERQSSVSVDLSSTT